MGVEGEGDAVFGILDGEAQDPARRTDADGVPGVPPHPAGAGAERRRDRGARPPRGRRARRAPSRRRAGRPRPRADGRGRLRSLPPIRAMRARSGDRAPPGGPRDLRARRWRRAPSRGRRRRSRRRPPSRDGRDLAGYGRHPCARPVRRRGRPRRPHHPRRARAPGSRRRGTGSPRRGMPVPSRTAGAGAPAGRARRWSRHAGPHRGRPVRGHTSPRAGCPARTARDRPTRVEPPRPRAGDRARTGPPHR